MKKADLQYPGTFRRTRRFGLKEVFVVISFILALGLGRSILSHYFRFDVVEEHQELLQREEAKKNKLLTELHEATSEAFIEKQAREKLGLVREGDTVILVQQKLPDAPLKSSKTSGIPTWQQWWKLFF